MSDNYQNSWGRFLFPEDKTRQHASSHHQSVDDFKKLESMINNMCKPYQFVNMFASGSQAIQWTMTTASFMRIDSILIGCGNYVSGDNMTILQHLSSSDETPDGVGRIKTEGMHDEGIKHTIALPYYIDYDKEKQEEMENKCLEQIHHRCLYALTQKLPIKVIMLELILANTGGRLSESFLKKLALLSIHHDFVFIVDEVLTSGRTGTVLYTQQMPEEFQNRVHYIAMGKWLGMGCVVYNNILHSQQNFTRGETTGTNYKEATQALKLVSKYNCRQVESRRKEVLKAINVTEENSWGSGILIFCNKVRAAPKGLGSAGRYLPMLESLPSMSNCVYSERYKVGNSIFSKKEMDNHIQNSVRKWLDISNNVGEQQFRDICSFMASNPNTEFRNKYCLINALCKYNVENNATNDDNVDSMDKAICADYSKKCAIAKNRWSEAVDVCLDVGLVMAQRRKRTIEGQPKKLQMFFFNKQIVNFLLQQNDS